ncbi:Hypothetical protein D9617_26g078880 [Elsinoe fawcettii]|nr:Hypothetical protein D9617_26g078880 [Elsinoe fawcettii]
MSAFQFNFTLRAPSSKTKSCHLVGSWDNYRVQVPLSRSSSSSSTPKFSGAVRFPASAAGQRYWYYFIVDGHSATYDPGMPRTVEPTTGRTLNILDLAAPSPTSTSTSGSSTNYRDMRPSESSSGSSRRHSRAVANGRALSPSQIQHPFPSRPYETKAFSSKEMEALSRRYAAQRLVDTASSDSSSSDDDSVGYSSYSGSDVPSLSSRSSHNSSPSSVSSMGGSPVLGGSSGFPGYGGMGGCTCERYAITRSGERVKVNCGGKVCAGSENGSDCSSSDSEEERARRRRHEKSSSKKHSSSGKSRRHGLVVRR